MRYYIADNHFFHGNMNSRMDCRGFSSVDEMNQYMIKQWNDRVRRNDEVVILGDFSLGNCVETTNILRQLNGRKFMISGGHDKFLSDKKFDQSLFQWVKPYAEMNDNGRKVVLCHYPIMCYNGQFRRNKDGVATTWMLHGHTHLTADQFLTECFKDTVRSYPRIPASGKKETAPVQMINCFCMLSDYVPLTLDEWIAIEKSGVIMEKCRRE